VVIRRRQDLGLRVAVFIVSHCIAVAGGGSTFPQRRVGKVSPASTKNRAILMFADTLAQSPRVEPIALLSLMSIDLHAPIRISRSVAWTFASQALAFCSASARSCIKHERVFPS
jgi:hypothetical protein